VIGANTTVTEAVAVAVFENDEQYAEDNMKWYEANNEDLDGPLGESSSSEASSSEAGPMV